MFKDQFVLFLLMLLCIVFDVLWQLLKTLIFFCRQFLNGMNDEEELFARPRKEVEDGRFTRSKIAFPLGVFFIALMLMMGNWQPESVIISLF